MLELFQLLLGQIYQTKLQICQTKLQSEVHPLSEVHFIQFRSIRLNFFLFFYAVPVISDYKCSVINLVLYHDESTHKQHSARALWASFCFRFIPLWITLQRMDCFFCDGACLTDLDGCSLVCSFVSNKTESVWKLDLRL